MRYNDGKTPLVPQVDTMFLKFMLKTIARSSFWTLFSNFFYGLTGGLVYIQIARSIRARKS